jgi:hypothetical protein
MGLTPWSSSGANTKTSFLYIILSAVQEMAKNRSKTYETVHSFLCHGMAA